MKEVKRDQAAETKKRAERAPYEPPTIIYEGLITTRSGTDGADSVFRSNDGGGGGGGSSVEKSDIFD